MPAEAPSPSTPTPRSVVTPTADGPGWKYAYIDQQPGLQLLDITAAGRNEAWAVGIDSSRIVLMHYDGVSWRKADPPPGLGRLPGSGAEYIHISASAPGDVWLITPKQWEKYTIKSVAVHRWNGSTWKELLAAPDAGVISDFRVLGPDDAWIIGGLEPFARRWDGRAWRTVRLPAVADSLAGTGPRDLWAVGWRSSGRGITVSEKQQPAAMHWNGRSWRLVPTPVYAFPKPKPPEGGAHLDAVVALARDHVWALGTHTFNHGEMDNEPADPPRILLHWDGNRWAERTIPKELTCCLQLATDGTGGIVVASGKLRSTWRLSTTGSRVRLPGLPTGPDPDSPRYFTLKGLATTPRTGTIWGIGVVAPVEGRGDHATIVQAELSPA
jgi:hypothetical protein